METYYGEEELKKLGLKKYGVNVKISRHAVIYNPKELEIGNDVRIDDFTIISGRVVLGDYIHIAQCCGLYGGSSGIFMKDYSGLSSHVVIYATSNDYSGQFMTNPTVPEKYTTGINKPVYLKKHVIVGCMSVILPGVTIGEGCAIGAMSLIKKDLDEWGIYAGAPVQRLKDRKKCLLDLENKLKEEINSSGKIIYDLKVGDFAERKNSIVYEDAIQYASITGDNNPIHFETKEAYQSQYGKPIAHGMILAGFVSGVIGEFMPGAGCIYEAQAFNFIRPVFYEDEIVTRITVVSIDTKRNRVVLKTECFNQMKDCVLTGEAIVLPKKDTLSI